MKKRFFVLCGIATTLVAMVGGMQTAKAEDVVFQAELENSLRLSLSDNDVMLVVNPLTMQFASDSMTATVATNNPYGYSLTAYSGGQVNMLRSELVGESRPFIAPLETNNDGYTEESFSTNSWGYKIGNGNYQSFDGSFEVANLDEPTNGDESTVGFAVKADFSKPAGVYEITLNFVALANVAGVETYGMQDISDTLYNNLPLNSTVSMVDRRTGDTYDVSVFMGDTKKVLWMNDNLRLPAGTILTPYDSNVLSNFTLSDEVWEDEDQDYFCKQIMTSINGVNYYNWYAATANPNDDYSWDDGENSGIDAKREECATTDNNAKSLGDICPKGWRLPTADEIRSGMFNAVANTLSLTGDLDYTNNGGIDLVGTAGGWWSSTIDHEWDDQSAVGMFYYPSYLGEDQTGDISSYFRRGATVRCVYIDDNYAFH